MSQTKSKHKSPYTKFRAFRRGTYASGPAETILVAFNIDTGYWETIFGTFTDSEYEAKRIIHPLVSGQHLHNKTNTLATYEWLGNLTDDQIKAQFARTTETPTTGASQ